MGKPFRVVEPTSRANIGRAPDGKFVTLEQPQARELLEEAKDGGELVSEVLRARRVPEKAVGSEEPTSEAGRDAVYADAIPWPPAGPINDAGRPPMRLKG